MLNTSLHASLKNATPLQHLLAELVAIPSATPPGDCRDIAAFIQRDLKPSGATIQLLAPDEKPEATSVVATLGQGSPVIMLHAHIDTVPIADDERQHWSTPPLTAVIKEGRLYGKGSVDDKAPLAAMMHAFKTIAAQMQDGKKLNGTLILVGAAEEEVGGQLGTRWLADNKHLPEADFIIVGEQTHNRIALAHKGVMRASVTVTGRSVHATNPERGINAITGMARIILALESYHASLQARSHALVGHPTCNVGVIQGGSTANAVPDSCTIHLDRRMIPREDPEVVKNELREVIAATDLGDANASVHSFLFSSWFDSGLETPYAKTFQACVNDAFGSLQDVVGYLPGSDAKHLMGIKKGDMIIFGPGSYEVAHAFNEYVDLNELEVCEAIIRAFLQQSLVEGAA